MAMADPNQIRKMNPAIKVIKESTPGIKCQFCHKSEVNELDWGPMYQLNDIVVHYFCMLFSAALTQNGNDNEGILGFMPGDLKKEMRRGDKLKCRYCKQTRATVGCIIAQCKAMFHFSCGVSNGTLHHFTGNFASFCQKHKPELEITIDIPEDGWMCEICFMPVLKTDPFVWPPCCKRRIFHRQCIQLYANNSGYFFSCPCCKAKDDFTLAMKKSGVYVPEQDATWELEPEAFQELHRMYSTCDAEECYCPKGRNYDSTNATPPNRNWKIVRCGACGSAAVHYCCGQLKLMKWKCKECIDVLSRDPSDYLGLMIVRGSSDSDSDSDDNSSGVEDNVLNEYENVRLRIAARSHLTGIERNTEVCSNPTDIISVLNGEVVEDDGSEASSEVKSSRKRRMERMKKIVYNPNFKKKYRVESVGGDQSDSDEDDTYESPMVRHLRFQRHSFQDYTHASIISGSKGREIFCGNVSSFAFKMRGLRLSCTEFQDRLKSRPSSSLSLGKAQARSALVEAQDRNLASNLRVHNLDLSEFYSRNIPSLSPPEIRAVAVMEDTESRDDPSCSSVSEAVDPPSVGVPDTSSSDGYSDSRDAQPVLNKSPSDDEIEVVEVREVSKQQKLSIAAKRFRERVRLNFSKRSQGDDDLKIVHEHLKVFKPEFKVVKSAALIQCMKSSKKKEKQTNECITISDDDDVSVVEHKGDVKGKGNAGRSLGHSEDLIALSDEDEVPNGAADLRQSNPTDLDGKDSLKVLKNSLLANSGPSGRKNDSFGRKRGTSQAPFQFAVQFHRS